jgi:hypothetical protein
MAAKKPPRDPSQLRERPCAECGGIECGSSRVPVCCAECDH